MAPCSNVGSGAVSPAPGSDHNWAPAGHARPSPHRRSHTPQSLGLLLDERRFLLGGALSNGGNFYTWLTPARCALAQRERLEEALGKDGARCPLG